MSPGTPNLAALSWPSLSNPSLLLPPYLTGGGAAAVRQCGSAGAQLASYGSPAGGTEITDSLQSRLRKKCSVCETNRLGIKKLGGVLQTQGKLPPIAPFQSYYCTAVKENFIKTINCFYHSSPNCAQSQISK